VIVVAGSFMYWKDVQQLSASQFQRLTGVKRGTFEQMLSVIKEHNGRLRKHPKRGKPPKLQLQDQLLMMLMYLREYRTFFHIAVTYGMSEGQCSRIIRKLESILVNSKVFHLPGRKALLQSNMQWEVLVIDVGESPVDRPKKNSDAITPVKRKDIHKKHKL
jgi:hypothetical protein